MLNPELCLDNHEQYICGTRGICICIDKDEKRKVQRWNFPFKSLDIANLYLRAADFTMKKHCRIYELVNSKGRKLYKIFSNTEDFKVYISKNKDKSCELMKQIYIKEEYKEFSHTKVKYLDTNEVGKYLQEQCNSK